MKFKYRERQILKILLNRNSVTGNEFSDIFNISTRTIRTDIKNINLILKEKGIEVSSNSNLGYFFDLKENQKEILIQILETENDSYKSEPEYRLKKIVARLIQFNQVDLNDMANELFISLSSVFQDVKSLEHMLIVNNIDLALSKQGNTLLIQSKDERKIRSSLALLLVNNFSDLDKAVLLDLEDSGVDYKTMNRILFKVLNQQKTLLGEHDLVFFATYLFVSVSRIRRKYEVLSGQTDEKIGRAHV